MFLLLTALIIRPFLESSNLNPQLGPQQQVRVPRPVDTLGPCSCDILWLADDMILLTSSVVAILNSCERLPEH
jgi:hypothetical protein